MTGKLIDIEGFMELRAKLQTKAYHTIVVDTGIVVSWDPEKDEVVAYNVIEEELIMYIRFENIGGLDMDIKEMGIYPLTEGFESVNKLLASLDNNPEVRK